MNLIGFSSGGSRAFGVGSEFWGLEAFGAHIYIEVELTA